MVELLYETTEKLGLIQLSEGDISSNVEPELWYELKNAEIQTVKISDELGDHIKEHSLDRVFEKDCIRSNGIAFNEDLDFQIASHWGSHCTFPALKVQMNF